MVTRKVQLTEEQNETLEQLAASHGRSVSDLIQTGLDIVLRLAPSHLLDRPKGRSERAPRLSRQESELLLQINQGLPAEAADRYQVLMSRRRAGALTEAEHRESRRLEGPPWRPSI